MLRKLIKYDFHAFSRTVLPLVIAIPLVGVLAGALNIVTNSVASAGSGEGFDNFGVLLSLSVLASFFQIASYAGALTAGVLVYLRYYKSVFTDEGYLTMSMPLSTDTLLLGKMLGGGIWLIFIGLSVTVAGFIASTVPEIISDIQNGFGVGTSGGFSSFDEILSTAIPQTMTWLSVGIFNWVGIYTAITLGGTLVGKNKFLMAVLFAFVLFVIEAIAFIAVIFLMPYDATVWQSCLVIAPLCLAGGVGLYFLSRGLLKKKYNVE